MCRENVFSQLKADLVEILYHKIGGVPRYVLQVASTCGFRGLSGEKIENVACGCIQANS